MRKSMTLLALAWSSFWLSAETWAQGNNSTTYFGWDGPPTAGGETYVANVYGDAIEIVHRGDECGRPFYIVGVMSIQPNLNTGTIGGTMIRCTAPELFDCDHPAYYEIGFQGTLRRDETERRLYLTLTYTMEIWNKDTCKKEREERRTENLQLLYQPPMPAPTAGDDLRTIYDGVKQILWDSFWTLGGRSPR